MNRELLNIGITVAGSSNIIYVHYLVESVTIA